MYRFYNNQRNYKNFNMSTILCSETIAIKDILSVLTENRISSQDNLSILLKGIHKKCCSFLNLYLVKYC